jgi:threonine-phosphate decarboxylase
MIAQKAGPEMSLEILPSHGGQLRDLSLRNGIPIDQLLDFSVNINPIGPPPSVLTALRAALTDASTLGSYPDLEYLELKQAISQHILVPLDCIVVANGFVPLLEAALQTLKIRRCLLLVPAFSEYRLTLTKLDIAVVPFLLAASDNFRYDIGNILKAAEEHTCDAILLANPQNPSGILCSASDMTALIEKAERRGIKVFVDEAFIDYAPSASITQEAHKFNNAIVFRSVTKFFAVPGLRVAFAVSNAELSNKLSRFLAPWSITTLASVAICAALADGSFAQSSRKLNEERCSRLDRQLQNLGHTTYRSRANFLLFSLAPAIDPSTFWERMIIEHRIVLRACANYENLDSRHFRAAVRSEDENDRLIHCLDAINK